MLSSKLLIGFITMLLSSVHAGKADSHGTVALLAPLAITSFAMLPKMASAEGHHFKAQTCGDVKAAYKGNGCCGKPDKAIFEPSVMPSLPQNSEQLLMEEGVISEIPATKCGAGKNVILVMGDGMGWEMIRAGAIAKKILTELQGMGIDTKVGAKGTAKAAEAKAAFKGRALKDYYTEGAGSGLSFQALKDYAIVTTSSMILQDKPSEGGYYAPTGQSMLKGVTGTPSFSEPGKIKPGSGHDNGMSTLALKADGTPFQFDPRDYETEGGSMILWNDTMGGKWPWDENYYKPLGERDPNFDIRFTVRHSTDSASTAGSLSTGVKTFTGAFGVDIYERPVRTIVEDARHCGKAAGTVTSVPMLHATPAAFLTHSNHRKNGPQMQRTMMDTVNPTLAIGGCASRYWPGGKLGSEHNIDYQAKIKAGYYGKWTVLGNKDGQTAEEALAPMANLDPDNGDKVMGCFPDGSVTDNMPYRGVDSTFSHTVLLDQESIKDKDGQTIKIQQKNTMGHKYTAEQLATIPKMSDIVKNSIEFLGKSDTGFFMLFEQGDIDWAAHYNHMDDMLGAMLDIDDSVAEIIKWIENNGGYEKNALYVTADHDLYLTLKPNFPEVLANFIIDGESHLITPNTTIKKNVQKEAKLPDVFKAGQILVDPNGVKTIAELQGWSPGTIDEVGHFWGVEEDGGNAWGGHGSKPVPMSYQGDTDDCIKKLMGKGYKVHGKKVRGSPDKIDQVHVHACMYKALMGF